MIDPALRATIERVCASSVASVARVTGGDINQTFALRLQDGRRVFLKTHPSPPRGMYAAEAHGLHWLAETQALRVPEVVAVSETDAPTQYLLLEAIDSAPKHRDHDERLGQGLAALHRTSPHGFGLTQGNFIALLPQDNRATADWPSFYAQRRLAPMLALATDKGLAKPGLRQAVSTVIARIDTLVGPAEPPARLHGDLWGGNAITDERGLPVLIDPAVYGGHREVDLAMMRLFGGFSARVFDAYAEAHPLSPGHAQRVALYQLYPLLVHVCLFGGHYVHSAEQAAETALSG